MSHPLNNQNVKIDKFDINIDNGYDALVARMKFIYDSDSCLFELPLIFFNLSSDTEDFIYRGASNENFIAQLMNALEVKDIKEVENSYCRISTNERGEVLEIRNILFNNEKVIIK